MAPSKQQSKQSKRKEVVVEENPTILVSGEGGTHLSPIPNEISQIRQVQDHLISTVAELSAKFELLLQSHFEGVGNRVNLQDREGIGTSYIRTPTYGLDVNDQVQGIRRNLQREEPRIGGDLNQQGFHGVEMPSIPVGGRFQQEGIRRNLQREEPRIVGDLNQQGFHGMEMPSIPVGGRFQQDRSRTSGGGARQNAQGGFHQVPTMEDCLKGSKLSFPKFDGARDPISWFSRVETFFRLHNVDEDVQVELASFHLEEDAQIWFDMLQQHQEISSWTQLKDAMNMQFGPSDYEDFYGDLTRLNQVASVQDYTTQFNRLATRAGAMTENQRISSFTCGLNPHLRIEVKARKPETLLDAQGLARHLENYTNKRSQLPTRSGVRNFQYTGGTSSKGRGHGASKEEINAAADLHTKDTANGRRFSVKQLQERKEAGLCFRCDDKFFLGHKCKQLFVIEVIQEEELSEQEDSDQDGDSEIPAISLNALAGTLTTNTMRLLGRVRGHQVTVLIDSGSSHNFVNEHLVQKLKLQVETSQGMKVQIANEEKLSYRGRCVGVELELPGYKTVTDFFALLLEEIDIVLGVQWLKTLGSILWNFESLIMSFTEQGKTIELQGLQVPPNQRCGKKHLARSFKKRKQGLLMNLQVVDGSSFQQQHHLQQQQQQQQQQLTQFSQARPFQSLEGLKSLAARMSESKVGQEEYATTDLEERIELLDYDEDKDKALNYIAAKATGESTRKGYVGIHSSGFRDFLLKPELLRAIVDSGFEHLSEVQHECIPQAILSMDVICQAKSGMGKTAVFVLSTLQQMEPTAGQVAALVLRHTRELAYQIYHEFERFSTYLTDMKVAVFYGGVNIKSHKELLKNESPHIVVGIPGRILALARDKDLVLKNVRHCILDEFDKMLESLDMRRDVQEIFKMTPHDKQVMMFSATLSKKKGFKLDKLDFNFNGPGGFDLDMVCGNNKTDDGGGNSSGLHYHFIEKALPLLVSMLLETLLKQEEDQDQDDGVWNLSMASGICLGLIAKTVGDAVDPLVMPFVLANIVKLDWQSREAATFVLGSVLEGPSIGKLQSLVQAGLDVLLNAMKDQNTHVKDTTAWTLSRIFEILHPLAIGDQFEKYLLCAIQMLQAASEMCATFDSVDEEILDYANQLRCGIFEAYSGILQGLKSTKAELMVSHAAHLLQFIEAVFQEKGRDETVTILQLPNCE